MIIIGFTGPPGAGKDTAYSILESYLPPEWSVRRYSFADPLRALCDQLMDLEANHEFWGQDLKDELLPEFNFHSPRELLIDLGMLGRKYRPDIWLDKAIELILGDEDEVDVAVITDVRFRNEARAVRHLGGCIVEICRGGFDYNPDLESESGQAVQFVTHVLQNDGEMHQFQRAVEDFWWRLISERATQ
jgi:hypothetical protein